MKLLDLFCGAGGAAKGYQRAGFYVVGIDNRPQPRYCGDLFIQADALMPPFDLSRFDFIHASPPCQAYSIAKNNGSCKNAPDLVGQTRALLIRSGLPWVMENVAGAPLLNPTMLCGAEFGLRTGQFDLARHRYFECSSFLLAPQCNHRRGFTIGVYGNGTNSYHRAKFGRCVTVDEMREAMGIDWMVRKELNQAIPPAYTQWIGEQITRGN